MWAAIIPAAMSLLGTILARKKAPAPQPAQIINPASISSGQPISTSPISINISSPAPMPIPQPPPQRGISMELLLGMAGILVVVLITRR